MPALPDPTYLAFRAGSVVARLLPESAVGPASHGLGAIGARVMGDRRAMVERHQRRVRPGLTDAQLQESVEATFASYAHYWIESLRLPGADAATLDRSFRETGFDHIRDAIDDGRSVILALPHLGGWEWAAFWLATMHDLPVTAVVERLEPPELADWFVQLREALGMEIIQLGPDAGTRVAKALTGNRILALLCDRDIGGGGIDVEFFGERTTLPGGPATLALRSGAVLLPTAVYFDGDGHHGVVRPPLDTQRRGRLREDVTRITQELAAELEILIEAAPEQWHLLQPNWPSDTAADGSDPDDGTREGER